MDGDAGGWSDGVGQWLSGGSHSARHRGYCRLLLAECARSEMMREWYARFERREREDARRRQWSLFFSGVSVFMMFGVFIKIMFLK